MYATQQDIESRLAPKHLVELADEDNDGMPDAGIIAAVLADAEGIVDSHLAGRYALPLSQTPQLLTGLAADLAVAGLFARRRESASETHEARARNAMDLLGALSRGELLLAGESRQGAPESTTRGEDKVFSKDSLENL